MISKNLKNEEAITRDWAASAIEKKITETELKMYKDETGELKKVLMILTVRAFRSIYKL